MADAETISEVTGEIHVRVRGKPQEKASPTGELRLDRLMQAIAGGVNVVRLQANERQLVIPSVAAQMLARFPQAPMMLLRTHRALLSAEFGRSLPLGVHLPDGEIGSKEVELPDALRTHCGDDGLIVSRSVHSLDAAIQAERGGADMLVLGTVFPSASHPGGPTIGLEGVREVCAAVRIPVIGIGGVTAKNAGDVIRAGASGVAVISAIFDAPDPRAAAAELRAAIDAAWAERGQS